MIPFSGITPAFAVAIINEDFKILASDGAANDRFGVAVSISGDTAIVGANSHNHNARDDGSAYIFERDATGTWIEKQELIPSDGGQDELFGIAVSISDDRAVIGANLFTSAGSNSGSAYIFERDATGTWIEKQKLVALDNEANNEFGRSVSISGDTVIIGAYGDDSAATDSGSAYIFERDATGTWIEKQKLVALDGDVGDFFGNSVSIDNDRAVVGASRDDDNGSESGSAYIFERDATGTWIEKQKLLLTAVGGFAFGHSSSISGNSVIISNRGNTAFIFERDATGTWIEKQTLVPSDAVGVDGFGQSVSMSGNKAVVGAYLDDDNGNFSGSAYIFERDATGTWIEKEKFLASDGAINDFFGVSVSISNDRAVVGAYSDDDNGEDSGAAYVFELNADPVCTNASPSSDSLWPPNHKFVDISINGVTDHDGDSVTITIDSIFQDEAVDAKGSGNTSPDGEIDGDTAKVRSERSGKGDGRVYEISFTADDGNGGSCSGLVQVGVPHDKKDTAVNSGTIFDSTIP